MKKTISIVLSLVMIVSTLAIAPFSALAATSGKCGVNASWSFDKQSAALTISGSGAITKKEAGAYPWSEYMFDAESVTVGDSITNIPNGAFCNMQNIQKASIGKSVKTIGESAFGRCFELSTVTFSSSNKATSLGDYAFDDCKKLSSINLPKTLQTIGYSCFSNAGTKASLSLLVPCRVNKIDAYAFNNVPKIIYSGTAKDYGTNGWWGAKSGEKNTTSNGHYYVTRVTTCATTTKDGKKQSICSCGKVKSTTVINKVSNIKLSVSSYVYDGNVKSPTLTVKDSAGNALVKGTDYTVSAPRGRKDVGKYTYKITFESDKYFGTVTKAFFIKPKGTTISSLVSNSRAFTVKWKKQAIQTTGYQIQYATDSKFTKNVQLYTVSNNSTVSKKITGLAVGSKYYVRVRTYKTVSGTKYHSSWSNAKSVITNT